MKFRGSILCHALTDALKTSDNIAAVKKNSNSLERDSSKCILYRLKICFFYPFYCRSRILVTISFNLLFSADDFVTMHVSYQL